MLSLLSLGIELAERGLVPDALLRRTIRSLCLDRLRDPHQTTEPDRERAREAYLQSLHTGPIAAVPEKANDQHYELPADFFGHILGPRRKYSCCLFADADCTLAQAEDAALQETCARAELEDGQRVLELGCGWGSLSIWMAERYPHSQITAVSNSASQRAYINGEVRARGLTNLRVVTADMNDFAPDGSRFDRVVSVEMFEHMRNYRALLQRIAGWLEPDGKLFVHLFCHRELTYPFETAGDANWMGRYFFTGGIMPSEDLLKRFPESLAVTRQWRWNGRQYQRTADAWLANLDAHSAEIRRIFCSTYGAREADRWIQRWRLFFLAVSELFGCASGEEWFVSHSLLEPVRVAARGETCCTSCRR